MKDYDQYRLKHFISDYKYTIVCYLGFIVIFVCVLYLYNIVLEPIMYATVLCTIMAIIILSMKYLYFRKKYIQLSCIRQNSNLLQDPLPKAITIIEQRYTMIIQQLREDQRTILTKWQIERNESIDYYSTWVHQIKTPIAVMRLILQSEDTPQNQELSAELFRIEQYVDMVLCYFRLDSSANDFVFRSCSLNNMI